MAHGAMCTARVGPARGGNGCETAEVRASTRSDRHAPPVVRGQAVVGGDGRVDRVVGWHVPEGLCCAQSGRRSAAVESREVCGVRGVCCAVCAVCAVLRVCVLCAARTCVPAEIVPAAFVVADAYHVRHVGRDALNLRSGRQSPPGQESALGSNCRRRIGQVDSEAGGHVEELDQVLGVPGTAM